MDFFYCWHRPGQRLRDLRLCRHCGVAILECPCVKFGRTPDGSCGACHGSGWVAIIRSRVQAVAQVLGIEASYQEAEDRWE